MWHVYILRCADGTLYSGITIDLNRRVDEHNNWQKGAKYTRVRRPVCLVYSAQFTSRALAAKEECRIKKIPRADKLALITKSAMVKKFKK